MHDTYDNALVSTTGNRYDDEIRAWAKEIWLLKADRNATRTQLLLANKCRDMAQAVEEEFGVDFDEDSLNIPTVRQVQRWVKEGKWAETAADEIARIAPRLYKDFNARLFAQVEAAQAFDGDVLAGAYDNFKSPGVLAIKEKVAARVQTLAAVGTAAGLMPPSMPAPEVRAVEGDLSPQEMGRRMREKLDIQRGRG